MSQAGAPFDVIRGSLADEPRLPTGMEQELQRRDDMVQDEPDPEEEIEEEKRRLL